MDAARYHTTKWAQYNTALKARVSLSIWLDQDMQWLAVPNGKLRRNQRFSDAAMPFCLCIKYLFCQPRRQAQGMDQSLLRLAKLDCRPPTSAPYADAGTPCTSKCATHRASLHLLVDSTGLRPLGKGEFKR